MAAGDHIAEDELPLDPDEFVDRFIAEVDEYLLGHRRSATTLRTVAVDPIRRGHPITR